MASACRASRDASCACAPQRTDNRCGPEYSSSRFQLHMLGLAMTTVSVVCSADMVVLVSEACMWCTLYSKDVKCRRLNFSECAEQDAVEATVGMVRLVGTLGLTDGGHIHGTWQRLWEL